MELLRDRKIKRDVIEERGDGPEVAAAARERWRCCSQQGGVRCVTLNSASISPFFFFPLNPPSFCLSLSYSTFQTLSLESSILSFFCFLEIFFKQIFQRLFLLSLSYISRLWTSIIDIDTHSLKRLYYPHQWEELVTQSLTLLLKVR